MNTPDFQRDYSIHEVETGSVKAFMNRVFGLMSIALLISGVTAFQFSDTMLSMLMSGGSLMMYALMFAPFIFILVMNFGFNKLSPLALSMTFIGFSVVMGMSLSTIFLIYDLGTIFKVFFITAGLFGTMAILGFTTSTDLTKMGTLLMMALIGMIIASIVNWFMQSSQLDYIISCVGVLVFTGLTAYDVQRLKRIGMGVEYGTATASKLAVMGALSLYLDFINLFIYLLRVFGNSRD
ncbi:MAG: Bax inhibitor-1/YccA family protein [Bacteroidetes bacterium]|nr:Bax inhibitor-1/YccA family protein [Bacteroidota bacterium]